jgi:TatD DNase family protein
MGDIRIAGRLVDAHCHIDLFPSPAAVIASAEAAKVYTIAVTNAPSVFAHTERLTAGARFVRAAAGLHPELVGSHGREVAQLALLLKRTRYVGEIGLDYTTKVESERKNQRDVFTQILACSAECKNQVLTLHSRRASADVIAAVGSNFPGRPILHWFSGSVGEMERAVSFGFYFSVNPAMVRSKTGERLIGRMPPDRVVTETDGPFVQVGSMPATPENAFAAIEGLSRLWKLDVEECRQRVLTTWAQLLAPKDCEGPAGEIVIER